MKNYILFLRWWILLCAMCVGVYYCNQFGLVEYMWEKDVTKISVVILSLFGVATSISGVNSFKASKYLADIYKNEHAEKFSYNLENKYEDRLVALKSKLGLGWFLSGAFTSLGMLGTVIGVLLALESFVGVGSVDLEQSKALISQLVVGISTALVTTLIGLTCSLLLKLQCFNIDYCIAQNLPCNKV